MDDTEKTNSSHMKILHDLFATIEYIITGTSLITETVACDNRLYIIQNHSNQPSVLLMYNDCPKFVGNTKHSYVNSELREINGSRHHEDYVSLLSEDSIDSVDLQFLASNYVEAVYGSSTKTEVGNKKMKLLENHSENEHGINGNEVIANIPNEFLKFVNYEPKIEISSVPHKQNLSDSKNEITSVLLHTQEAAIFNTKVLHYCRYCSESFDTFALKHQHEQDHLGRKPYGCKYCNKRFMRLDYKENHERIHKGEKPFKCDYCGKPFIQACDKVLHERTHTGHKPFKCAYCAKTFSRLCRKKIHERHHTGEKPYSCRYCERRFFCSTSRNDHERTHTGVKPHKCSYCNKAFSKRQEMQRHEFVHTRQKPYSCDFCDKKFIRLDRKRDHEILSHKQ